MEHSKKNTDIYRDSLTVLFIRIYELFSNPTYSEKYKAFEFNHHLLRIF